MAYHSSIVFCVSFILACILFSKCDAVDNNPKLHIVYMGALPKTPYSPTSHHLSLLQQISDGNQATGSLIHSYKRSFNGFAAMLTNQQKEKLSRMEGIVSVFPSRILQTLTTRSWDFLGITESVKRSHTVESDVVVGVIDTGIWPESDSFNDKGFGPIPEKWKGTCAGGKNFTCNKKIIGARFYVGESARDNAGHGTHTASTAAGNNVRKASFYGLAEGTARGGVPSARIAAYKVCRELDCESVAIMAAFDDSIADGVDVLSLSLGGYSQLPFDQDPIAIGSFHAMARGILTVHAAGNSGPVPYSTSSIAPWMLSVAASTIDRQFIDTIVLGNGKKLTGKSINSFMSNGTKFPIAKKNRDSKECSVDGAYTCNCLDSQFVKGKIVLCGTHSENGAVNSGNPYGVIMMEIEEGTPASVTSLPSLTLSYVDYDVVTSYTNSTKDPKAEIMKSEAINDHNAPIVATFSSRGPNNLVPEILKPDISAPGVEILAAFSTSVPPSRNAFDKRSTKYNILSGTSMSCPHVTGIVAYLKTFHSDWSPAAIKSAIMTSAQPMKGSKDEIGEFSYGSGHVNPIQAIEPGLVYDIFEEDYVQMLCNLGYGNKAINLITGENHACPQVPNQSLVRNLNYPTLAAKVQSGTSFTIKFNRTITNVGQATSTYNATILPNPKINITVAPTILSFKSLNEKQSFIVTVTGEKLSRQIVLTSSLIWSDGTHNVRSPIVVQASN
ncbi:hypothetical protein RIF29_29652 [Crotalaria pallida]|uniref:Cucumisin n=1 Tax=Crotalaria pallida TaxID=3830 RepID=A0AAN9EEY2_CROPI